MADNPPITTTVPETVTVDTGADPQSTETLNESFKDFWAAEDAKVEAPEPPPAPSAEGAAQETKVKPEAPPKPVKTESTPIPTPKVEQPQVPTETDDEFDRFQMTSPHAPEKVVEQFKHMKDLWRADRDKAKALRGEVDKLSAQLIDARNNAWTPEARADYEHAASIRRKFDFASDPEFIQRYHQPIWNKYQSILADAVNALPDRQAAQEWAQGVFQNYPPDALSREWWLNGVINKIPNELERQSILSSVTELLKMQRERDGELHMRTADRSAFDNWIKEKSEHTAQRVQSEIMTEIGLQEQRIKEVLPRNIDEAKTKEEREAISAHNERFEKLNNFFKDTMQDLSRNGPRAWVRASVQATRAMVLDQEYQQAQDELKTAKAERDKYKAELDKIVGARRKLASTAGTPPAPPGARKDGQQSSLSLKDLDVRKAFDNYQWGDNT